MKSLRIALFTEFLDDQTALLVDANSVEAIANAMLKILNQNLRTKLINHSQVIPCQYSWQKSAQIHFSLYQSLL